ncbi:MAG: rRNA maturation RNase YbeY [Bacteroidales bacterium]|nr:rRNA maturation RNase YbeY [Candidatus Colimorpha onthohippi]
MAITFAVTDVDFELPEADRVKKWIIATIENQNLKLGNIGYLFCSDAYLLEVNKQYLNHDTYTDIITFDYVEADRVSGDILISVDRVSENAKIFQVPFEQELHRVIIHGILHLLGQEDKSDRDAAMMRKKEDEALLNWNTIG